MKNIFFLLMIGGILITCSKPNNEDVCPYELLSWGEIETKKVKGEDRLIGLDADILLELEKKLNFKFSPEFKYEIHTYSFDESQESIKIDSQFVMRWNSYVTDICGSISLMNSLTYKNDSLRIVLEEQIINRVKSFYESVYLEPGNTSTLRDKATPSNREQKKIPTSDSRTTYREADGVDISIYLDGKYSNIKDVYLSNGLNIVDSNSKNIRIKITSDITEYKITLISSELDSCILSGVIKEQDSSLTILSCV
ncbi:MAG: hypothetical protein ACRBG0_03940 [Lewinella sp.]|uniref:hypothetical protein n=1 Tax=Lewinella sp. TaxID=2004506 RepID=UPI003D6ADFD2